MQTQEPPLSRRDTILDVAEALFARHGYDGVTLRSIAREAGVDVALANYHFGRKLNLFDAVLMRRAEILNKTREEDLQRCLASALPDPPSVENIIRAYLRPLLMAPHIHDAGWRNYYALIAYVNNSTQWGGKLMTQFFDPLVEKFIAALRLALPDTGDESLYWCYHFLSGALTLTFAQTGRLDLLSGGVCRSEDLEASYEHMVAFVTAGFETACRSK